MDLVLLLPFLLVGGLLLLHVASRRRMSHPAFWLTAMYAGSAAVAPFVSDRVLQRLGLTAGVGEWVAMGGFGLALVVSLVPAIFLKNGASRRVDIRLFEWFVALTSPLVIFALVYLTPFATAAIMMGAAEVRFNLNSLGIAPLPASPLTTIAVVTSQFYMLYALAFVFLITRSSSWWLRIIAFLGSTLYIVNALCFTARDGIVWFLVAYVWALWFAKPLIDPAALVKVKRMFVPIAFAGVVLFGVFSVQRFTGRSDGSLQDYMMVYYGSQPYVFATTVREQQEFYGGRLRFPLVFELLGEENREVVRRVPYEWSFGTFVKDIYAEGGWSAVMWVLVMGPPILILIFAITPVRYPEAYALFAMLYVQFMAQGVFYIRLGMRAGNLYALCIALLACVLMVYRIPRQMQVGRD